MLCLRSVTGLTSVFSLCFTIVQTNLKDSALRETARQKVQKAQAPKYRDRASERRVLFNQPDAPMPETAQTSKPMAKREASGPPRPPTPPPAPLNPGQDTNNVGNKLLKMMGWTEGTGLGTSGEGRVDPMYALSMTRPIQNLTLVSVKQRYTQRVLV